MEFHEQLIITHRVVVLMAQRPGYKCTVHRCTGAEALYRPYGPWGSRGIGKGTVHCCTGTEALYRPYGP